MRCLVSGQTWGYLKTRTNVSLAFVHDMWKSTALLSPGVWCWEGIFKSRRYDDLFMLDLAIRGLRHCYLSRLRGVESGDLCMLLCQKINENISYVLEVMAS